MKNPTKLYALIRAIKRLTRWVYLLVGAGSLLAMIALITGDVILRFLFERPIMSSYEIVMFLMAIAVFTTLSYTETEKGHVTIELLVSRFPKKVQKILDLIMSVLSMCLFALITQQTIVRVRALEAEGLTTSILHIPVYPFYLFGAFGFALLTLVLLANIVESLMRTGEETVEE